MKIRQRIISVLCVCAVMTACGCTADKKSEPKSSSDTEDKTESSQAAEDGGRISALEAKVEEFSDKITELENKLAEFDDFDFEEEIHEVYDDTAVVEAYKSGDDSALTDEKDKFILKAVTEAIDEIIKDDMTDYEKEKAVYEYIYKTTRFDNGSLSAIDDSDEFSHTPYGVLHDHTAICVGKATTFKLFMDILGIENELIHSTEEGEHAWNLVKIDGDWYHVDITFDGGGSEPSYSYLNVTDRIKLADGYPWDDSLPECTSTKYCYSVLNAKECKDIYALPEIIAEAIENGDKTLYVRIPVPDGTLPEAFTGQLQCIGDYIEGGRYFIMGTSVMLTDNDTQAVAGYTIESELDGLDDFDIPDDTDITLAEIDYDKLRELFEEKTDGEVSLSEFSSDEVMSYVYGGLQNDLYE